jgi:hypothetical protein
MNTDEPDGASMPLKNQAVSSNITSGKRNYHVFGTRLRAGDPPSQHRRLSVFIRVHPWRISFPIPETETAFEPSILAVYLT